jgi:hypothetical protein
MAKKGPISNVEKFYIDGHINDSPESLAKELDRTVSFIEKYIKENINTRPNIQETKKGNSSLNKDQFARRKGAVVMTEAASEIGDDNRRKVGSGINLMEKKDYIVQVKR